MEADALITEDEEIVELREVNTVWSWGEQLMWCARLRPRFTAVHGSHF